MQMLSHSDIFTDIMAPRHLTAVCFAAASFAALLSRRTVLVLLMALGVIESYALFRYPFHNIVRDVVAACFPHSSHIVMQSVALCVATIAAGFLLRLIIRHSGRSSAGKRVINFGSTMILAMLAIELISHDYLEAFIYLPIGPFFLGNLWIAFGALVIVFGCAKDFLAARRR